MFVFHLLYYVVYIKYINVYLFKYLNILYLHMCLYCRKCVTCFTYCRCRCTYLFTLLIYLCTNEGEKAAFQGEAPPAPAPGTGATRGPCVRSIISSLSGENLTPEHPVVHSAFLRPPLNTPTLMRLLPDPLGASRAGGGSCSRPSCAPAVICVCLGPCRRACRPDGGPAGGSAGVLRVPRVGSGKALSAQSGGVAGGTV